MADEVRLRDGWCVFPWCRRPARQCDLDKEPLEDPGDGGPPGQTSPSRLAPPVGALPPARGARPHTSGKTRSQSVAILATVQPSRDAVSSTGSVPDSETEWPE